jgi:murein DD-endopeptidase MepM/ murein hydrolase activator NlpD
LGPIYYGQEAILNVFDHELPLFRLTKDGNNDVRHYNGAIYLAVTPTPSGEPYIPVGGYGYDQHVGIDYNLRYEPVLAAANGQVAFAGWSDPTNHRRLYGLHVQMNHHDNLDYRTWYGHLSTLTVKTGDLVLINPVSPADRNRTLGISGNTGSLEGCNAPVNDDPLCSAHLHFEVRQRNVNRPTNPYGWVAPIQTVDPWSVYVNPQGTPAGATSYDLWATRPAVTSAQYGTGGEALVEPPVAGARMIIDDASADFKSAYGGGIDPSSLDMDIPIPDCWQQVSDSAAYNHAYRRVLVTDRGIPTCGAFWYVRPDAFTPPGDYDVFVHIPSTGDQGRTLGAAYTIRHNGQTHTAIVVQAAYVDNDEHDAWAYIGR